MRLRLTVGLLIFAIAISGCSVITAIKPLLNFNQVTATPGIADALPAGSDNPNTTENQDLPTSFPAAIPTPQVSSPAIIATLHIQNTPAAILTPTPVPESRSDLLYLVENKLMRWDYRTKFSSLLVDNVAAFSVSQNTRQVALLRPKEITANGTDLYNLDVLDLSTKQITHLVEDTSNLMAMSFSSQGERLVYVEDDQIFSINTKTAGEPQQIAKCSRKANLSCSDMVVGSPDGRALAWRDALGIWMVDDKNPEPRLVQSNQVEVTDPKGQKTQNPVDFDQLVWSPDSRFILVKIIPSASGVQWYGLVDTRKARLVDIPSSGIFSEQTAHLLWSAEGGLMLAHSNDTALNQPPFIQTWRLIPTANNILSPDKFLYLGADAAQISSLFPVGVSLYPDWLHQFDPITFGFGIIHTDRSSPAHLYQINIQKNILSEIVEIPADTQKVLWAPDNSGALILGESGQVYFASLYDRTLLDLGVTLGKTAGAFAWLSPVPRD